MCFSKMKLCWSQPLVLKRFLWLFAAAGACHLLRHSLKTCLWWFGRVAVTYGTERASGPTMLDARSGAAEDEGKREPIDLGRNRRSTHPTSAPQVITWKERTPGCPTPRKRPYRLFGPKTAGSAGPAHPTAAFHAVELASMLNHNPCPVSLPNSVPSRAPKNLYRIIGLVDVAYVVLGGQSTRNSAQNRLNIFSPAVPAVTVPSSRGRRHADDAALADGLQSKLSPRRARAL